MSAPHHYQKTLEYDPDWPNGRQYQLRDPENLPRSPRSQNGVDEAYSQDLRGDILSRPVLLSPDLQNYDASVLFMKGADLDFFQSTILVNLAIVNSSIKALDLINCLWEDRYGGELDCSIKIQFEDPRKPRGVHYVKKGKFRKGFYNAFSEAMADAETGMINIFNNDNFDTEYRSDNVLLNITIGLPDTATYRPHEETAVRLMGRDQFSRIDKIAHSHMKKYREEAPMRAFLPRQRPVLSAPAPPPVDLFKVQIEDAAVEKLKADIEARRKEATPIVDNRYPDQEHYHSGNNIYNNTPFGQSSFGPIPASQDTSFGWLPSRPRNAMIASTTLNDSQSTFIPNMVKKMKQNERDKKKANEERKRRGMDPLP